MPPTALSSASSDAVMQTLVWARRQKFKPVPLLFAHKASISRTYTSPEYTPPDDNFWMKQNLGVGVVTGPLHSGPVDIDLDCPEAVALAPFFLPPTPATFGRKSKPNSHYLYRSGGPDESIAYEALADPRSRHNILEVRGDGGHQTVMPGSIHEGTGEAVVWSGVPFPDVPYVHAEELSKACRHLAIACLVSRYLWSEGQRNDACRHLSGLFFYLEWPIEDAQRLISAVMEYGGDTDASRKRTIELSYRRGNKNGVVTGATGMRKWLGDDKLVDRILRWVGPPEASMLLDWNERFAVVDVGGKYRIANTSVEPGSPPTFYSAEDFIGLFGDEYVTTPDGKTKTKAAIWLASSRRRRLSGVDFMPGLEDSGEMLNLWTGWAIRPKEGECKAWLELLYEVICGGDQPTYNWMLHWLANIVREPAFKSMTCPVLIGTQGAGKSLCIGYFGRILGRGYTVATHADHVTGQFNAHLATTLLLHSEEALYGQEKKHRGVLKSLITDEWRIFEPKGVDRRPVRNYLRLIMSSNAHDAAPVEADDRRFSILNLGRRAVRPNLVRRVLQEMQSGGPAALFQHLLDMDYDPSIPRRNLRNDALAELKPAMGTPVQSWWWDVLSSGKMLPEYLDWAQQPVGVNWPPIVGSVVLYQHFLHSTHTRYPPTAADFYLEFASLLGQKLSKGQRTFHNTAGMDGKSTPQWVMQLPGYQNAIRNMPTLEEARKAYEARFGQEMSWPEPEAPEETPVFKRETREI